MKAVFYEQHGGKLEPSVALVGQLSPRLNSERRVRAKIVLLLLQSQ